MNIDLLTLQHTLARQVGMAKTSPKPLLDALPDTLEAKVIALATVREAARQTFLLTLLLPGQHETLRITSDVAAPRESTVVLQRINGQWQLVPPSKELQRQALIQVQQASIPSQLPPLAETWQALQLWQQALQNQANLPSRAKKQLVLLRELLTSPAVNPVPNSGKEAHQNPQKIRQHINASGLFMEANFADKGRNITTIEDKKWLLMRLFQSLQQPPKPHRAGQQPVEPQATLVPITSIARDASKAREAALILPTRAQPLTQSLTRPPQTKTWPDALQITSLSGLATQHKARMIETQWQFVPEIKPEWQQETPKIPRHIGLTATHKPELTSHSRNAPPPPIPAITHHPILPLLSRSKQISTSEMDSRVNQAVDGQRQQPSLATAKPNSSQRIETPHWPTTHMTTNSIAQRGQHVAIEPYPLAGTRHTWVSLPPSEPGRLLNTLIHPAPSLFKVIFRFNVTSSLQDSHTIQLFTNANVDHSPLWLTLPLATPKARSETNVDKLIRQVFSGIMRIHSLQLESVSSTRDTSSASPSSQHWHLDIPLLIGERWQSAQCHIYRQHDEEKHYKASHEKTRQQWGMRLRFELDNLGTLTVDAHLAGHQLNTTLWADTSALQTRVKKYREDLLARLREGGLHIDDIPCQLGNPPPLPKGKAFHQEVTT